MIHRNPFIFPPPTKAGPPGKLNLLAPNGNSRIYGSPVMRRVRRVGPPSTDPLMRKSVSLSNVEAVGSRPGVAAAAEPTVKDAASVPNVQQLPDLSLPDSAKEEEEACVDGDKGSILQNSISAENFLS
jgi:hypothetical protein